MKDKMPMIQQMLIWNSVYEYAYMMFDKKATEDNISELCAAIENKVMSVVEESVLQAKEDFFGNTQVENDTLKGDL